MGTRGFSVLRRVRALAARRHHVVASAAGLVVLGLAVAGCADLSAGLRTDTALQAAGYQNVNVNVESGSGSPAGGLITVSYSSGPAGNDHSDGQRAEKIVWDTFSDRFGALAIVKESGGCTGPFCTTQSGEVAGATYAQLAAEFGPRPAGLGKTPVVSIPRWAIFLALGLVAAVIGAAAIAVTLILRRKGRRRPGPPPLWPGPPGPGGNWPDGSAYRVP
jgi:hypothetical protein